MKKQIFQIFLVGFFCQFLLGCSWVERFVIYNTSQRTTLVNYTLNTLPNGLHIFNNNVQCFELKNNSEINWDKEIVVVDKDTALLSFSFDVPKNSVFIFGSLHNDTYKTFNTNFINGYKFNLSKMEIVHQNTSKTIIPETFDTFFKKEKGIISYTIN
jgi:hypothetical protein